MMDDLFDIKNRLNKLNKNVGALIYLFEIVPWEKFRST